MMIGILYTFNGIPWLWILFKSTISKGKRKASTNISKISFPNKCVELNNLPHIFHDSSVNACLPTEFKFDHLTVVYSLTNPIRSKIFSFNKFVSNPQYLT